MDGLVVDEDIELQRLFVEKYRRLKLTDEIKHD